MSDKQLLRVAMVDDEEPLCLAVARILDKYQVHVDDVGVDVAYACTALRQRRSSSSRRSEGHRVRPAAPGPEAARA